MVIGCILRTAGEFPLLGTMQTPVNDINENGTQGCNEGQYTTQKEYTFSQHDAKSTQGKETPTDFKLEKLHEQTQKV